MTVATYTVTGMSCGHCIRAVTEEIEQLAGVQDVEVDLPTGAVTVSSTAPLPDPDVRGAIEEAGYEVVGGSRN